MDIYNNKREALARFGGNNNSTHNESPITTGPCFGTLGAGLHWNVRLKGKRIGSIVSCTCCRDTESGPVLEKKYKAVD